MTNLKKPTIQQIKHLNLNDLAFRWSIEHNDTYNMQLVLRAYGFSFTELDAMEVIDIVNKQL